MANDNRPLFEILNENRTKGTFEAAFDNKIICDGKVISVTYKWENEIPVTQKEANAQYTALAVNNLHILAEALERIIDAQYNPKKTLANLNGEIRAAKEALSAIS